MFKLANISLSYGPLQVLSDFSLESKGNEFICLLGSSGIGKTTILNVLADLLYPQSGQMIKNNQDIAYVFQEPRLLPWCTVEENISMGLYRLKMHPKEKKERIAVLADKLSLKEFASYYPAQLSGGMKQRVSLGRAFAIQPDLLLMDEPFASLDENLKNDMRALLKELIHWQPCTTVFVTHDIREAIQLADRIVVLKGRPCNISQIIEPDSTRTLDENYIKQVTDSILGYL
ncbi:MAG: ABC transporter ATP-binding protein [Syntrophomonas sp.]|nr:ABC transporter ATP-binding protein [Syntrophomonas sp.]